MSFYYRPFHLLLIMQSAIRCMLYLFKEGVTNPFSLTHTKFQSSKHIILLTHSSTAPHWAAKLRKIDNYDWLVKIYHFVTSKWIRACSGKVLLRDRISGKFKYCGYYQCTLIFQLVCSYQRKNFPGVVLSMHNIKFWSQPIMYR